MDKLFCNCLVILKKLSELKKLRARAGGALRTRDKGIRDTGTGIPRDTGYRDTGYGIHDTGSRDTGGITGYGYGILGELYPLSGAHGGRKLDP